MLKVTDLRGKETSISQLRRVLPRAGVDVTSVLPKVELIVDAVRERGAEAALEHGMLFDGIRPPSVRVPAEVVAAALEALNPQVRDALE